ncbi:NAD(P)-binding protein [Mytilinidion resinicola]|uniref:NAD(P)-binding protein n=1 Tax=Mytilinidion resinicola TaxID=574789 RepID=A0A6A6Y0W1_9PEZI|nr:NAD(P)-binding protein [Mytilinidion resinicola]KAF2801654.1 NAD(P)-binding protein [Mytilinidion resinicola]
MADQVPDPDTMTRPFQLTASIRRGVYPAVDPTNPSLSAAGKVVVVVGAAGGIGYATAKSWSTAGAAGIVLVGRTAASLEKTAADLKTPSLVVAADVSNPAGAGTVFEKAVAKFGKVDALVYAAGYADFGAITGTVEPEAWWGEFTNNLRGRYNTIHHFIKATNGSGTIVNLVSYGAMFVAPGMSAYSTATLAAIKLGEYLDVEHPNLRVFSIHPGIVAAEGGRGAVVDHFTPFAKDKPALTGGLTLYLQTPAAEPFKGGFISVNWDVVEMEKHKEDIVEGKLLRLGFINAKLGPGGVEWAK